MPIRTVLLDIDGTLIDSNDAHAACWVEALAEFGIGAEFSAVRRLIGKGGDKLLPELTGIAIDSTMGQAISKRRSILFMEQYVANLRAFSGTRELLSRLHAQGLRLVVATSAQEQELERLVQIAGADGLLYEATSSSEVENSKPDPDIIQVALGKASANADETLMLGDTPYDIEAAARAGVRTVALRCGGWDDQALSGAIAIFDNPEQLLAQYEQSPFAQGR